MVVGNDNVNVIFTENLINKAYPFVTHSPTHSVCPTLPIATKLTLDLLKTKTQWSILMAKALKF